MTARQLWSFEALDTWFFKESRPMEAVGGAQLQSVFPPPARTVIGAIRTAIGEALAVDWQDYARNAAHPLRSVMGDARSVAPLSFVGPVVTRSGKRLFPAPLALLAASKPDTSQRLFTRLTPSEKPVACDIGKVRLPVKQKRLDGAKPLEGKWLSEDGLQRFLRGEVPVDADVVDSTELISPEDRLGIGRDVGTGSVEKGLLYQTCHVRPMPQVGVGMWIDGLAAPGLAAKGMARFGAEGRMATWTCLSAKPASTKPRSHKRLLVVLLTHASFSAGWVPDDFVRTTQADGTDVWEGVLHGVKLRLVSAVLGKPVREGGWDMASAAPRAMESLVPAGSCYFFECMDGAIDVSVLDGKQMGQDTQFGRGEFAVGTW